MSGGFSCVVQALLFVAGRRKKIWDFRRDGAGGALPSLPALVKESSYINGGGDRSPDEALAYGIADGMALEKLCAGDDGSGPCEYKQEAENPERCAHRNMLLGEV